MKKIIISALFILMLVTLVTTIRSEPVFAGEQINHNGHCAGWNNPFPQCTIWSCSRTWRVGSDCGACEKIGTWYSCRQ